MQVCRTVQYDQQDLLLQVVYFSQLLVLSPDIVERGPVLLAMLGEGTLRVPVAVDVLEHTVQINTSASDGGRMVYFSTTFCADYLDWLMPVAKAQKTGCCFCTSH